MDQRNLVIAVVISILIMVGYEQFFAPPKVPAPQTAGAPSAPSVSNSASGTLTSPSPMDLSLPDLPRPGVSGSPAEVAGGSRQAALEAVPRVRINSPRLHGSISLKGARIDDLTLADYREEISKLSPEIVLLKPAVGDEGYFSEFGWQPVASQIVVPRQDTVWTADGDTLSPDNPVTLRWDNGAGLRFERMYAIDNNYMFTVVQRVVNSGNSEVVLRPYGLVQRRGTPNVSGFYILHEGPLGVLQGSLKEINYQDGACFIFCNDYLKGKKPIIYENSKGGWAGFTDKYWLAALIPDQQDTVQATFQYGQPNGQDQYQVNFVGGAATVAPGATYESTSRLFAGAKEVALLDAYEADLSITHFDRAIDFGWFYWLTKPIFHALNYLFVLSGNFGIAIMALTVFIKLLFFPLANKSYVAMSKMKKLQPELVKLRERFGEDRTRMNQEMMALYKREGANPVSGCLPMLIQIPVFFSLYKVLFVTIEMRQAPFYGWIKDLSQPDPTTIFNLFGLIPWTPPELLAHLGLWPIIMGVTMFFQQKLNPQPADPVQAKIFLFMPLVFTALLASFPAGLVIYWAWNNVLSILQQWTIMRRMGVKA